MLTRPVRELLSTIGWVTLHREQTSWCYAYAWAVERPPSVLQRVFAIALYHEGGEWPNYPPAATTFTLG